MIKACLIYKVERRGGRTDTDESIGTGMKKRIPPDKSMKVGYDIMEGITLVDLTRSEPPLLADAAFLNF